MKSSFSGSWSQFDQFEQMEEALSLHVALCSPRSLSLRSSPVYRSEITALPDASHLLQGSEERADA